jgi:chromate reductase
MSTTRILAIAGSLRRGSYNRRLLEAAAAWTPDGISVELSEGIASLPLFDEDLEREHIGGPPAVRSLRAAIRTADALLIATPEYNHGIPGVLKNAIDWLSRPGPEEVLARKPVAVIGATTGRWGTRLAQSQLRQVLTATEAFVLPAPTLFVASAAAIFDETGQLSDPSTGAALRALLAAIAQWCHGLREIPHPEIPHPG